MQYIDCACIIMLKDDGIFQLVRTVLFPSFKETNLIKSQTILYELVNLL